MRERMLAGDPYIADDPDLAEENAVAMDLMAAFNATAVRQAPLRRHLLEQLLGPGSRLDKWETAEPITIDDNVWLGGGVIVCPGVSIGENTVVGAGAVVTRDLPANVVAVGNPASVIRRL
jgi:acetyltransferase-like isoleucine patch superfamily enzyme